MSRRTSLLISFGILGALLGVFLWTRGLLGPSGDQEDLTSAAEPVAPTTHVVGDGSESSTHSSKSLTWEDRISLLQQRHDPSELGQELMNLAQALDYSNPKRVMAFWKALPRGDVSLRVYVYGAKEVAKADPVGVLRTYKDLSPFHSVVMLPVIAEYVVNSGNAEAAFYMLTTDDIVDEWKIGTANALGILIGKWSQNNYEEAKEALEKLPESHFKDQVIIQRFKLQKSNDLEILVGTGNREVAGFVDMFKEKNNRMEFLRSLASVYSRISPESGLVANLFSEYEQDDFREELFTGWVAHDINSALKWLGDHFNEIEASERDRWISDVLISIAKNDGEAAFSWVNVVSDDRLRADLVAQLDAYLRVDQ